MPDETHLVSDKLFITDNLHIKENEEFITLLDFVHKHSITNLKFPIEAGIDEDSYDTQSQVIAALEDYLKPSSALPEDKKSIWLLKRKDGKIEPQDDTRDEFYFNETEQHLERIGSTKIDFSDITDDVTFKAAVTFQTPDGKNVVFIKSPKVGDYRVLDEGDVQQTINTSLLPPSSNAVKTYVDSEKLTLVKENTDEGKVYIGPNSNLTVGPNDSTFKTPIKLNSTGATQSPTGTLSNDDGVLKWNGEEVGGTLTVTDNNPGGKPYEKTKEIGFQGKYVAMIKDSSGAVQLYIRENTDNPSMNETVPSHDSLEQVYIYKDSVTDGYQLPKDVPTNTLYSKCVQYNQNQYLEFQFKNIDGGDNLKIETIQTGDPEDTPLSIKIYTGSTLIATLDKTLRSINQAESGGIQLHTNGTTVLKVWNGQPNYKENVEGGKSPFTLQADKLFIKLKQSLITREGGSFRIEVIMGEKTYTSDDIFLYKNDASVVESLSGQSASVSGPKKYVSGEDYFTTGSSVTLGGQASNLCYYFNRNNVKVKVTSNVTTAKDYTAPSNADKNTVINLSGSTSVTSGSYGDNPTVTFTLYKRDTGTSTASIYLTGKFWCKSTASNGLSEDFWGENDATEAYRRKTLNDGNWNSSTSIDVYQPEGSTEYGLQVKYGQLIYPTSPYLQNVTRTYYRWFKGSGASTLNRFDITVAGTLPNDFFNANGKTRLEILNNGNYYRINALESAGGIAKSTPSSGKWRCEYSSVMTKPSVGDGFFLKISTSDTSLKLGKITVVMNPA